MVPKTSYYPTGRGPLPLVLGTRRIGTGGENGAMEIVVAYHSG